MIFLFGNPDRLVRLAEKYRTSGGHKNDLAFSKRWLKIANSFKDELWQDPIFELKTLLEPLTASTMQLGLE